MNPNARQVGGQGDVRGRSRTVRLRTARGSVLILVVALLGILFVVGVTFLQTLLNRDLISIFPLWEDYAARDPLVGNQTANSNILNGRR